MFKRLAFRLVFVSGLAAVASYGLWNPRTTPPPRTADRPATKAAAAPVQPSTAVARQAQAFSLPGIDSRPGEPWPGEWIALPPDELLPKGLKIEVTQGVITGVVSEEEPGKYRDLLGSRYVPGDLDATDVTRPLWRYVSLVLEKPDGSEAKLQVARPLWWFEETGAKVGASIDLSMHEVGIEGTARVLTVGPCDVDSRENKPGANIVIGKIEHQNAVVWDLVFNGNGAKPLGVTANHPIFSFDRDDWVPAGDLRINEKVLTADGLATLTGKSERPGRHTVYNLEVHRSHSYYVSQFGILAHNTGIGCDLATFTFRGARRLDGLREATHADIVKAFKGSGFTPSNHFITRVKDIRTYNLGMRTFKDLETVFRRGTVSLNRIDPNTGHRLMQISHGRFNIVFDEVTKRLVTLEPL